ncbi:unnamed protein product [Larinioides sclopetarius]|uniref:Uncharacterized protein n=1 Tax=Larinioides sclopetarius TaxID=280406 RepID=A0AAV1ZJD5_9ARAC
MNEENTSGPDSSSVNRHFTENSGEISNQEVAGSIQSEQQSNDICTETEDNKYNLEDPHSKSEVNYQQAEVLREHDEANLDFSTLNGKRKLVENEMVSTANPVKIQKNIKCERVKNSGKQKAISLRRQVLCAMTKKRYLSETDGCSQSSHKTTESQSETQDLQNKNSEIVVAGKKETSNDNLGSTATNSSFLHELQFQHASLNRSQEVSTNENQPSSSSQSTFSPVISCVSTMKSQSQKKIRAEKEVWEHFKWFLQTNKESYDRTMTGDISGENTETTDHTLNNAINTVRESTSQSLGEPFKLQTEDVTHETQDSLERQISPNRDDNLESVIILMEEIRSRLLKEIKRYEESLLNRREESHKEKNLQKKIKFLTDAKRILKMIHKYFDVLCNQEQLFKMTKTQVMNLNFSNCNLSNITDLMDLPLSASKIRAFSSLFLYLYKSLYYEIPFEIVFKRIDSDNFLLAYRRYRERKVVHGRQKEMSKDAVIKHTVCFNLNLEECRLKMRNVILHAENKSSEDDQNYINDIRIAIKDNLNCLCKLISAGSSIVFLVAKYLSESRKAALFELLFLDKRRSDVFPLLV